MSEKIYPAIVAKCGDLYFDIVPMMELNANIISAYSKENKMPELLKGITRQLIHFFSIEYNDDDKSIDVVQIVNPFFNSIKLVNYRRGVSFPYNKDNLLSQKDFIKELDIIYERNEEEKFYFIGAGTLRE